MFDTLEFSKQLQEAGFTRSQAENQARGASKLMTSNFATREDAKDIRTEMKTLGAQLRSEIRELAAELRVEMQELRTELRVEIKELRTEFRSDMQNLRGEMKDLEHRLTLKMGGMFVLGITILAALMKIIR